MKLGARQSIAAARLSALGMRQPVTEGPRRGVANLQREISEWLGEIGRGAPAGAFRTCFRLVPSGSDERDGSPRRQGLATITTNRQSALLALRGCQVELQLSWQGTTRT